jgi:hypothetical protein
MFRSFAVSAFFVMVIHGALIAAEPQQYLIRINLTEECAGAECPAQRVKQLAAPSVTTVDGRETDFMVGQDVVVGDKQLHDGTKLHFKVTRVDDTHAQITGSLEVSSVNGKELDFVVQSVVAAHFKRTITLGGTTHTELIDGHGKKYVVDLTIDKAPAQTAKRQSSGDTSGNRY